MFAGSVAISCFTPDIGTLCLSPFILSVSLEVCQFRWSFQRTSFCFTGSLYFLFSTTVVSAIFIISFLLFSLGLLCPWNCDITLSQYLKGQRPFDLWLGNWKVWKTKKYRNWGGQNPLGKKLSPSEQFIQSINKSLWKRSCFWIMCFGPEPVLFSQTPKSTVWKPRTSLVV